MSSANPGNPSAKLRPAAILAGLLTDVGGSLLAQAVVAYAFGADPADAAAVDRLSASPAFLAVSLSVALASTALGGFVAAHLAKGEELNNAFVMGVASAVSSLMFTLGTPLPLWFVAVNIALTVPAALAGGYARAKTRA